MVLANTLSCGARTALMVVVLVTGGGCGVLDRGGAGETGLDGTLRARE